MKPNSKSEVRNEKLGARSFQPSTFNLQPSRRGIALVITLIMLSVTLVMAIAFIAVSRRSRNASTTGTDSTVARLAADAALAAAQAQIVANIFVTNTAAYDFGLLVSTNYKNTYGYVPGFQNPTNVNYNYRNDGNPLNAADFIQNIANLFLAPRVPVSIYNRATGQNDFRFYLDLNRNGLFEDTGSVTNIDNFAKVLGDGTTGDPHVSVIGDPQWVGILERPDQPHSADNHFVARYAFFAQPIGNSLDLNTIHNQAQTKTVNQPNGSLPVGTGDGFLRNQGVGSWELNLAAFFADLNTNVWAADNFTTANYYQYNQPFSYGFNSGVAFDDARALLSYRYNFSYANLASANQVLANPPANTILPFDNIDTYSDGPLQTTTTNILESLNRDKPANSWVGANNPNSFYALPADLFDTTKVPANFISRLSSTGTSYFGGTTNSTYDRYTFYRLLSQLGTDSTAGDSRMNLNYDNLTPAINGLASVNGTASATNLLAWTPLNFFTNAADRLLKYSTAQWLTENNNAFNNYTNAFGTITTGAFGVTKIPVYVDGRFVYTPAVNRLLQLAANLYDATTNDVFPSVFRPLFTRTGTNVFITGYTNIVTVSGPSDFVLSAPTTVEVFAQVGGVNIPINIYGVPWIIGAKKGFPSFNKFYSQGVSQFGRKIEVRRDTLVGFVSGTTDQFHTNIANIMSITNHFGYSFWNPYNTDYPHGILNVTVRDKTEMVLSNDAVTYIWLTNAFYTTNFTINQWPGSAWTNDSNVWPSRSPAVDSFAVGSWDVDFIPQAIYSGRNNNFISINDTNNPLYYPWDPLANSHFPNFTLITSNALQSFIIDQASGRVVDYVSFAGPNSNTNLNNLLHDRNAFSGNMVNYVWSTNAPTGANPYLLNYGILDQIKVSRLGPATAPSYFQWNWNTIPGLPPPLYGTEVGDPESAFFNAFFTAAPFNYNGAGPFNNVNYSQQAPYTPFRYVFESTFLQASDPLVHYLYSDLVDVLTSTNGYQDDPEQLAKLDVQLNLVGSRYQPWGRNNYMGNSVFQTGGGLDVDSNPYNLSYRDSLVWSADFWDFPTHKYPSVGWIGRVHRGTPWQTVFLKATNLLSLIQTDNNGDTHSTGVNTWKLWTGGSQNNYDALHSTPVNDRFLFELFTAAPNDNSQRGTLSVNQIQLASLSALLSGVVVLTNITDSVIGDLPSETTTPVLTNMIISPAGFDVNGSAYDQILFSIANLLSDTNAFPAGVFTHVGDILRVPALTDQSPFINFGGGADAYPKFDISDELYEWLPQQTMGLLRLGTPSYVVYCYGQALKPAQDGRVLGGNFSQLVTNYQVVAESAIRVILRVDNPTGTNGSPRVIIESSRPLAPE